MICFYAYFFVCARSFSLSLTTSLAQFFLVALILVCDLILAYGVRIIHNWNLEKNVSLIWRTCQP